MNNSRPFTFIRGQTTAWQMPVFRLRSSHGWRSGKTGCYNRGEAPFS
ncbi:MAG: hypothetical protein K5896_07540 [Prevotella sp.]|nr:hypothetical protein [Prevotella sp.]